MGVTVGVLCVIVSYPVALFLARSTSKWRGLLIAIAIAPLLTSAVVRTYGWMVILGTNGLVNSTLADWGLIDTPLKLTNNMTGVTIGLVEIFMPYAILAMISGFGRLSPQLEEAAGSLGASKFRVFTRVTLPLSLPGILTAFLLVFVLSISTFITPRLLGGGSVQVLATEIYDQTTGLLNWPFAAALSVILLVLFGLIIAVYQRLTKKIGG
jgi:putative spermidine/putrescine transport system permease protein